jgi:hypothetical protein
VPYFKLFNSLLGYSLFIADAILLLRSKLRCHIESKMVFVQKANLL